jgi:hypothetical protein
MTLLALLLGDEQQEQWPQEVGLPPWVVLELLARWVWFAKVRQRET